MFIAQKKKYEEGSFPLYIYVLYSTEYSNFMISENKILKRHNRLDIIGSGKKKSGG